MVCLVSTPAPSAALELAREGGQVDDDRLLRAARDHHHGLGVWIIVLLAVWGVRRDEDVVPWGRLDAGLLVRVRIEEDELWIARTT